jgi:hypothetical protein
MKIKGTLVKKGPFVVRGQGTKNMCITLHELTDAISKDKYFEVKLDNGIIQLIPEELYQMIKE